jgi:hypothetical protein
VPFGFPSEKAFSFAGIPILSIPLIAALLLMDVLLWEKLRGGK